MKKALGVLVLSSILIAACEHSALVQMRRENAATEIRVADKEREIKTHEEQRTALLREQEQLRVELETEQMTANELNAKLERLLQENARIDAETQDQQNKKDAIERQLKKYQSDIAAVQKDKRLPDDAKKKRIDELKKQISAHLKLMTTL